MSSVVKEKVKTCVMNLGWVLFTLSAETAGAQEPQAVDTATSPGVLTLDLEFRPRAEVSYGYRRMPSDTSRIGANISQRARLNLTFERKDFIFHSSVQDIRVWGEEDPRTGKGWLQVYETWVQPKLNRKGNWAARIGRQKITYDNERLFARNNWRQAASKHDAVRLMFDNDRMKTELIGAFNQTAQRSFGTVYDPSFAYYKVLATHYLFYRIRNLQLTTINFTDGYQDATDPHKTHFKYTSGGRILWMYLKGDAETVARKADVTLAAYYQYGRLATGDLQRAYYLEPELSVYPCKRYQLTVGAQVFSGDDDAADGTSHAFLAQYGAFHRHNGHMDYTAAQVATTNHQGLINPYIKQAYTLNDRVKLSWDSHLLGTNNGRYYRAMNDKGVMTDYNRWWGWENDFAVVYKANAFTTLEASWMCMFTNATTTRLPAVGGGDAEVLPWFAYLTATWTPQLFNSSHRK